MQRTAFAVTVSQFLGLSWRLDIQRAPAGWFRHPKESDIQHCHLSLEQHEGVVLGRAFGGINRERLKKELLAMYEKLQEGLPAGDAPADDATPAEDEGGDAGADSAAGPQARDGED